MNPDGCDILRTESPFSNFQSLAWNILKIILLFPKIRWMYYEKLVRLRLFAVLISAGVAALLSAGCCCSCCLLSAGCCCLLVASVAVVCCLLLLLGLLVAVLLVLFCWCYSAVAVLLGLLGLRKRWIKLNDGACLTESD